MTHHLLRAMDWLNPAAHLTGLGIAAWAFFRCRKRGYLLIAIFFALAAFALLGMPRINRRLAQRRAGDIPETTKQKMNQAMKEAADRVLEEAGHPPLTADASIRFPLGPLVLIAGLWMIARRELPPGPGGLPPP